MEMSANNVSCLYEGQANFAYYGQPALRFSVSEVVGALFKRGFAYGKTGYYVVLAVKKARMGIAGVVRHLRTIDHRRAMYASEDTESDEFLLDLMVKGSGEIFVTKDARLLAVADNWESAVNKAIMAAVSHGQGAFRKTLLKEMPTLEKLRQDVNVNMFDEHSLYLYLVPADQNIFPGLTGDVDAEHAPSEDQVERVEQLLRQVAPNKLTWRRSCPRAMSVPFANMVDYLLEQEWMLRSEFDKKQYLSDNPVDNMHHRRRTEAATPPKNRATERSPLISMDVESVLEPDEPAQHDPLVEEHLQQLVCSSKQASPDSVLAPEDEQVTKRKPLPIVVAPKKRSPVKILSSDEMDIYVDQLKCIGEVPSDRKVRQLLVLLQIFSLNKLAHAVELLQEFRTTCKQERCCILQLLVPNNVSVDEDVMPCKRLLAFERTKVVGHVLEQFYVRSKIPLQSNMSAMCAHVLDLLVSAVHEKHRSLLGFELQEPTPTPVAEDCAPSEPMAVAESPVLACSNEDFLPAYRHSDGAPSPILSAEDSACDTQNTSPFSPEELVLLPVATQLSPPETPLAQWDDVLAETETTTTTEAHSPEDLRELEVPATQPIAVINFVPVPPTPAPAPPQDESPSTPMQQCQAEDTPSTPMNQHDTEDVADDLARSLGLSPVAGNDDATAAVDNDETADDGSVADPENIAMCVTTSAPTPSPPPSSASVVPPPSPEPVIPYMYFPTDYVVVDNGVHCNDWYSLSLNFSTSEVAAGALDPSQRLITSAITGDVFMACVLHTPYNGVFQAWVSPIAFASATVPVNTRCLSIPITGIQFIRLVHDPQTGQETLQQYDAAFNPIYSSNHYAMFANNPYVSTLMSNLHNSNSAAAEDESSSSSSSSSGSFRYMAGEESKQMEATMREIQDRIRLMLSSCNAEQLDIKPHGTGVSLESQKLLRFMQDQLTGFVSQSRLSKSIQECARDRRVVSHEWLQQCLVWMAVVQLAQTICNDLMRNLPVDVQNVTRQLESLHSDRMKAGQSMFNVSNKRSPRGKIVGYNTNDQALSNGTFMMNHDIMTPVQTAQPLPVFQGQSVPLPGNFIQLLQSDHPAHPDLTGNALSSYIF